MVHADGDTNLRIVQKTAETGGWQDTVVVGKDNELVTILVLKGMVFTLDPRKGKIQKAAQKFGI